MIVVVPLHNRPGYTAIVLEALARHGGDRTVLLFCEPVCDHVIALAKKYPCRGRAFVNAERLGCNRNTRQAVAAGLEEGDRVVVIEDDVVPGRGFFDYMDWALDEYEDDAGILTVSGYQQTPAWEVGYRSLAVREPWFTPWGWGSWRGRLEEMLAGWPDQTPSWDVAMNRSVRGDRCEVRPLLSRVQNIGSVGGANVRNERWHDVYQHVRYWSDNCLGPDVRAWREVGLSHTSAPRSAMPG